MCRRLAERVEATPAPRFSRKVPLRLVDEEAIGSAVVGKENVGPTIAIEVGAEHPRPGRARPQG